MSDSPQDPNVGIFVQLSPSNNVIQRIVKRLFYYLDAPVTYVREQIVLPRRGEPYPWYHKQYRRVPMIDECYTDDVVCIFEAQAQHKRDKRVEEQIVAILRRRYEDCLIYNNPDSECCKPILDSYNQTAADYFCKYGDIGPLPDVTEAYMKQKHRMIWERRHGPVGSGMKKEF